MITTTRNYTVKTPHYKYTLNVTKKESTNNTSMNFFIGDNSNKTCLKASLFLPEDIDERLKNVSHICALHKIDALEECALDFDNDHSFGIELLYSFISILKSNFKHITQLHLADMSYIPCNRAENDTLDLLTYSIALYGASWYEQKAGAYILHEKYRKEYRDDIKNYILPSTKVSLDYNTLYTLISKNKEALEFINGNPELYETMYANSKTFPEFFRKMSNTIPKADKCKIFKDWLEGFIETYVTIHRDWCIDINNTVLNNVFNETIKNTNRTRRRQRRKRSE